VWRSEWPELARVDRLFDEAVGADRQAGLAIAFGGDGDDRRAFQARHAAQPQRHLVAVEVGDVDVYEHQVRSRRFGEADALQAAVGVDDLVARRLQKFANEQAARGVVFDVQDSGHGGRRA